MLDSMRSLAHSFVAKALMIFLVISFAVWGVGDMLRNRGSSYLVEVGDEMVGPTQFQAQVRHMQQALEQMGVQQVQPAALQGEVLRQIIQQKLLEAWQHDSGLVVGRDMLTKEVGKAPQFINQDGQFDAKLFHAVLQQRGLTEGGYLADLSHEIGSKAMLAAIDSSDISAPDSFLKLAAAAGTQTRDAVLITIPPAPLETAKVSDDDAKRYYDAHKNDFIAPEKRTLEYVVLDEKSLEAKVDAAVTDKAQAAEQREQALQDLGMDIEDALAGGKGMGEAVASTGVASTSKLLKDVTQDQFADSKPTLQTEVVQQGFALGEGESSTLQSTPDGTYYMVSVKALTPAAPKPLDAVLPQVKEAVAKTNAYAATMARLEAVKAALAAHPGDWSKAAEAGHGTSKSFSNLKRPVVGPNGQVSENTPLPAALQQALFEHAEGEVAGPTPTKDGTQLLAVVSGIHTSHAAASDKERVAAEADYQSQLGAAVSNGVLRAVAARHPVNVNQGMLQELQNAGN